jgi:serine/threonine protein kinase/tetratricopeptide (TPR) repeat protein
VEDKTTKEELALKLIKPEISADKKTIERFTNELTLAHKISHRNVCRMFHLGEDKGTYYITMEYIRGEDLKSLLRKMGHLRTGQALTIAKQVCEGLEEAHRLGVIHRDLKPQNIMIDSTGNARIMDFGIARSLEGKGITDTGMMIGTPEYMSPEQVEGKQTDQRSDIYSLGVIFYELMTGRVPFEGDTPIAIGIKHKDEHPTPPKQIVQQIPEELDRTILKCLEKDRNDRYQSAEELLYELDRIAEGVPPTERIVPERKPTTAKEKTMASAFKKVFIPALVVIALVILILAIWKLPPQKGTDTLSMDKPSIAVLPFKDNSPQKDQEYLCEGFAESIITALTNVEDLRVPAINSSFLFKGRELDFKEIGEKLNVETILQGSVQKAENRVRVTAQLINISDGSFLWTDQYNRELDDIFGIQDEITMAIVDNLKVELLGEDKEELIKRYTENPDAYDFYLQGRAHWNKRSPEGTLRSIDYFNRAIQIDPNYALAHAGLADSYILCGEWHILAPNEAFPKAKDAALKALEIDEKLAEAHNALAMINRDYEWDWEKAEREFQRAIELNPNYPTAHQWYAEFLVVRGRFDEAIAEIKRAQELDPLSLVMKTIGGMVYHGSRKFDLGIEECQKVLDINPSFMVARLFLGLNLMSKGLPEEAILEFQKALELSEGQYLGAQAFLGYAYAITDKKSEAREILRQLQDKSTQRIISPGYIAFVYIGLGEKDRAMEWLERGYEEKDWQMVFLKVYPQYDSYRSDPRFLALLKKMNLD